MAKPTFSLAGIWPSLYLETRLPRQSNKNRERARETERFGSLQSFGVDKAGRGTILCRGQVHVAFRVFVSGDLLLHFLLQLRELLDLLETRPAERREPRERSVSLAKVKASGATERLCSLSLSLCPAGPRCSSRLVGLEDFHLRVALLWQSGSACLPCLLCLLCPPTLHCLPATDETDRNKGGTEREREHRHHFSFCRRKQN